MIYWCHCSVMIGVDIRYLLIRPHSHYSIVVFCWRILLFWHYQYCWYYNSLPDDWWGIVDDIDLLILTICLTVIVNSSITLFVMTEVFIVVIYQWYCIDDWPDWYILTLHYDIDDCGWTIYYSNPNYLLLRWLPLLFCDWPVVVTSGILLLFSIIVDLIVCVCIVCCVLLLLWLTPSIIIIILCIDHLLIFDYYLFNIIPSIIIIIIVLNIIIVTYILIYQ